MFRSHSLIGASEFIEASFRKAAPRFLPLGPQAPNLQERTRVRRVGE